jgi:hypothetical protein
MATIELTQMEIRALVNDAIEAVGQAASSIPSSYGSNKNEIIKRSAYLRNVLSRLEFLVAAMDL